MSNNHYLCDNTQPVQSDRQIFPEHFVFAAIVCAVFVCGAVGWIAVFRGVV